MMSKANLFRLLLGLIVFLVFLKWINILDAVKYLSGLNLVSFSLGCLMMALSHVIRAIRFHYLAGELSVLIEFRKNVLVHFIVSILGMITPGKLGEGGKVYLFQNNKKELTFCFILEKLADLSVLIVFAGLGSLLFKDYIKDTVVFFVILLVVFVSLFKIDKILNLVLRRNIFEDKWFQTNLKRVSYNGFISLTLTTLVTWSLTVFAFYLYAASAGVYLTPLFVMQLIGISTSAGIISGSPGGIGVKEFIITHLLSSYVGIGNSRAGIIALINTFGTYLTFSVIALCSYYLYLKLYKLPRGKLYQDV
ncbi:MAG TPA: lysylphosphatidylglycerol synthase transmembrane domain-containing protein [Thermodesulfobacteriota bacterium]|nr:lysylphosphatidylglycerol synthase transmembrane domain-containing protein [Thermodesulfobacteriota bacterium]